MRRIGIILLRGVTRLLSLLPLKIHYLLSVPICWILKDVVKYRRKVVLDNLKASFPDKSPSEINTIFNGFYRHFARIFVEAIWYGGSENSRLHRQHISEVMNPKVLNDAYASSPSVMVLTSHMGNWEIFCGLFAYNYDKENPFPFDATALALAYKKLNNELWEDFFGKNRIHCIRKQVYTCYVKTSNILRYAVEHKNEKKIYLFASDQYPYGGTVKMKVDDFLHQETYTMSGGAALARKFGMNVVYMGCLCNSKGQYQIYFENICNDASSLSAEEIMNRYYKLLQRDIEACPSLYLWSHRRWKNLR